MPELHSLISSARSLCMTAAALTGLMASTPALAETRSLCVYDPGGKSGETSRLVSLKNAVFVAKTGKGIYILL